MAGFTENITNYINENVVFIFFLLVIISILIYTQWEKKKRLKKIEADKEKEEAEKKEEQESHKDFDTPFLYSGLTQNNFIPDNKLAYLKERRDKVKEELRTNIDSYNRAKKHYKELVQMGKSLLHVIEVLKQEEARYDEQIKGMEHAGKN